MTPEQFAHRTFYSACILGVTVRTTGYCGGDSGHGGRTEIVLTNEGSFDFRDTANAAGQVVIRCGGDCELDILIQALQFAAESLRALTRTGGPR